MEYNECFILPYGRFWDGPGDINLPSRLKKSSSKTDCMQKEACNDQCVKEIVYHAVAYSTVYSK